MIISFLLTSTSGLPLADMLQPDILVQEVTGEDRMREKTDLKRGEGRHGNGDNGTAANKSKHGFLEGLQVLFFPSTTA